MDVTPLIYILMNVDHLCAFFHLLFIFYITDEKPTMSELMNIVAVKIGTGWSKVSRFHIQLYNHFIVN